MVLRLYSWLPAQLHNHLIELEGVITSSTSCLYFSSNTYGSSTKIIFCKCGVWTTYFFLICANFVTAAVLYHVYHSHGLSLFSFGLTYVWYRQVRGSAVFVPEHPGDPPRSCMYTYSIRLSVPEACMLGGVYYSSCQLNSRHWIIRSRDRVDSDVRGEGVIGQVCRDQEKNLHYLLLNTWMCWYIRKIKKNSLSI
jgi:hypothetical protein